MTINDHPVISIPQPCAATECGLPARFKLIASIKGPLGKRFSREAFFCLTHADECVHIAPAFNIELQAVDLA